MRVAVIGSRTLRVENLEKYLPEDVTELVSGGADGIDSCAKAYAIKNNIPIKEFLPDYDTFAKRAPLIRNIEIIKYSDIVLAFWDKKSHGTKFVIDNCKKLGKPCKIFVPGK